MSSSTDKTTTYKVVAGDTGRATAKKLGISFKQLEDANPRVKWNNLQVGQVLHVPGNPPHMDPPPAPPSGDHGTVGGGPVIHYSGPASNFPSHDNWQKFSLMWKRDAGVMKINDTPEQITLIEASINQVAKESGIDPRVILSVIMQESQGNVHILTTVSPDGSVRNPGLMQSHNGVAFNSSDPHGSILQMVRDGVVGTKFGDGLKQCLAHQGNIYAACREYNSGSVDKNNLSNGLGATNSYVSDIANRLMGAPPN